jgi:hypothetical protein
MNKRLITAMSCYAALALLAAFTLDGGKLRNLVWLVLGYFAIRTYVSYRAGW